MRFIHRIILAAIALGASVLHSPGVSASAPTAFVEAPQEVFPLLDRTTRMDMIDYFNNGMSTASANNINGHSRITALSPESVSIEMSDASDYQLVMLPAGNDTIIGVITTVKSPAPDSRIDFFSKDWVRQADGGFFVKPQLSDWLTDEGKKNSDQVNTFVPFLLIGYSYDPSTQTLTLTNNTSSFLSSDIYDIVAGDLRSQLTYKWNGKKFTAR